MIINCLISALLLLLLAYPGCFARTPKDDLQLLQRGNTKVFEGIISGDLSIVKEGLQDGGNLIEALDPFIGEAVLKLGQAHVTFPVVPPLHMAFNYGRKEHITIANYLIGLGADVNAYELPSSNDRDDGLGRGYAPAFMYALGLGQQPNGSHAVMVERLHKAFGEKFKLSSFNKWASHTGNPPLTHMCILLENFDCLYLALSEFILPVMERDVFGMTALHIAAWNGDLQSVIMLLHNGADLLALDNFNRSPLFLATIRRNLDVMALLLGQALTNKSFGKGTLDRIKLLLFSKDKWGKDIVDLILQSPTFSSAIVMIEYFILEAGGSFQQFIAQGSHRNYMWNFIRVSKVLPEVEIVSSPMIQKDEFLSNFHSCLRPALFVDQLTRGFGIWAYNSIADLCQRFGRLSLKRSPLHYPVLLQTVESTLNEVLKSSTSNLPFTMQAHIDAKQYEREFSYDFRKPEMFSLCGDNDIEPFTVTLTPAEGGLKFHSHNSSWNLLLTGKKSWFFIPPEVLRNVSFREELDTTVGIKNSLFEFTPMQFLQELYPLLVAQKAVIEVVQHAQEVVYVPHMWQHLTFAHEDSVAVSQQFCTLIHTDIRAHPVSWIIYGGQDEHRALGKFKAHVVSNTHLLEEKNHKNRKKPSFEFAQST